MHVNTAGSAPPGCSTVGPGVARTLAGPFGTRWRNPRTWRAPRCAPADAADRNGMPRVLMCPDALDGACFPGGTPIGGGPQNSVMLHNSDCGIDMSH